MIERPAASSRLRSATVVPLGLSVFVEVIRTVRVRRTVSGASDRQWDPTVLATGQASDTNEHGRLRPKRSQPH
jgi:hypothetical protein